MKNKSFTKFEKLKIKFTNMFRKNKVIVVDLWDKKNNYKYEQGVLIYGSAGSGKELSIFDTMVEKYGSEKALEMLKGANSIFEPKYN